MPNPVVHFEIQSNTPEKSQQFYRDLFGWDVDANNPFNYGMVAAQGSGIGGGIGGNGGGHDSRVTFYVAVDDPQAYLDKAEAMGGKTLMPPTNIGDMVTVALFADFEGNVIGLAKDMPQPEGHQH